MSSIRLSDLQLDVVRVLWEKGESSTALVHRAIQQVRDLAYTTVATVLKRLEDRGVVSSSRVGRELVYQACITEQQVKQSMVSNMVGSLFKGDPRALVAHLVRETDLREDDLREIHSLLEKEND